MKLFSPESLTLRLQQSDSQIQSWKSEKARFYHHYPRKLQNSAEATTNYQHSDISLCMNPKLALYMHTRHLPSPTVVLIGVGSFRPQSPEYRFVDAIKPSRIIAIEPHVKPQGPQLEFESYNYDLTDPVPNELLKLADIATLFDSVIMDIAPGLLIRAFIHLSKLVRRQGFVAFDTNLGYEKEVCEYNAKHPEDPYGIFERQWESTSRNNPIVGKFMRIDKQTLHSLATYAGFSHVEDHHLETWSFSAKEKQVHPRLTSIWQKKSDPNPKLLALIK